jgi:hypothetical protein
MMDASDLRLLFTLAFGAGGAWFFIKQSRKDVNGLGAKVNAEIKTSARRHINIALALMLVAPTEEIRKKIADLLREDS